MSFHPRLPQANWRRVRDLLLQRIMIVLGPGPQRKDPCMSCPVQCYRKIRLRMCRLGWFDQHLRGLSRLIVATIMDSQARQLPRYVFQAVASPAEYLICSNSETAFWLLTSIITLTNVTYLVRAKAGIKSGHKQAATQILPSSTITERKIYPVRFFLTEKQGTEVPKPLGWNRYLTGSPK